MLKKFGLQVQPLTPRSGGGAGYFLRRRGWSWRRATGQPGGRRPVSYPRIVITQVGGEEISSMDRLAEQLSDVEAGDMVSMSVVFAERHGGSILQEMANISMKAR